MDLFTSLQGPFAGLGSQGLFLMSSTVILLIIIFFMYKTYRASMNVEARLSEFASLSQSAFGRKLRLIEVNADEYKLNKRVLGPLARIIDEYCVMTTNEKGIIILCKRPGSKETKQSCVDVLVPLSMQTGAHSMPFTAGRSKC